MKIASALPGGLTRANFIVAIRSLDMTAPFLIEGAKFNMNGNKDAYFVVLDTVSEMVPETHLCPEFQRRTPGTGYRG